MAKFVYCLGAFALHRIHIKVSEISQRIFITTIVSPQWYVLFSFFHHVYKKIRNFRMFYYSIGVNCFAADVRRRCNFTTIIWTATSKSRQGNCLLYLIHMHCVWNFQWFVMFYSCPNNHIVWRKIRRIWTLATFKRFSIHSLTLWMG